MDETQKQIDHSTGDGRNPQEPDRSEPDWSDQIIQPIRFRKINSSCFFSTNLLFTRFLHFELEWNTPEVYCSCPSG